MMTAAQEFAVKCERVRSILDMHSLNAVVIQKATNLAWLLAGAECWIGRTVERGSCSAVITRDDCHVLMNAIEAPRLSAEELADLGATVHEFAWHQDSTDDLITTLGGACIGSDAGAKGSQPIEAALIAVQTPLTPPEVERYRALGRDAGEALGVALRQVEPGMTEHQIASLIAREVLARGAQTAVLLVAVDDRAMRYRHPVPTDRVLAHYVMGVIVARRGGLHASATRCAYFGELPEELALKHQRVCAIDGLILGATREGATAGDVFAVAQEAYAEAGYPDEWQCHHQGGATGYQSRTWRATPGSREAIRAGQAFAWNPSLQGTKSEDTIMCHGREIEVLTATPGWPTVAVPSAVGALERAAILTA
jgi:Xaa-Pro aminopeptidase